MPDEDDDQGVWHLGSQQPPERWAGYRPVNVGKPISDGQFSSYQLSVSFLEETFVYSAFAGFRARFGEFMLVLSAWSDDMRTEWREQHLHRKLDDLLSAFRKFDDQTSHELSRRYGAGSREYETFKRALSFEYDDEFAYRFSCRLRNYSQHCGWPISGFTPIRRWAPPPDDDIREQQLVPFFDSRSLLENYNGWPARLRQELQEIDGTFPVGPVIDALGSSCKRAFGKGLLAQEARITAAVGIIRKLAEEATTSNDLHPFLIRVNKQERGCRTSALLAVTPIRVDVADIAETAIQEARAVAGPDHS